MKKLVSLFVLGILCSMEKSMAQGCSDAGFCTIHSLKNNTEHGSGKQHYNDIAVGFSFGKGERSISYYNPYIEYTRSLGDRTSLTGKVIYSFINGELANTTGLSDVFVSVNHAFDVKNKWKKSFVAGFKFPIGEEEIIKNGVHIPMAYQPSLGTVDFVIGLNFLHKSLGISAAWQQPINSNNDNRFLPDEYPANNIAQNYPATNQFGRKADVLMRGSYNFNTGERFSIRPSLLAIYHLGNDSYEDGSKMRREIPNSAGLTLNGNVFINYRLNNSSEFEMTLGTPFVVRDSRPDGLTRSFVWAIEYKFNF